MGGGVLGFCRREVNLRARLTSVRRLLELLEEEILGQIRNSQIRLVIRIDEIGQLTLDEMRMARCLANIIKNAKEALGDEGTITIHIRDAGSQLKISISDNGPGIPEFIRGRISERLW